MAWPASADSVISTAETQTSNIETFVNDVMSSADTIKVLEISAAPLTLIDDPDWVDPGDGSTAPQIPDTYFVKVGVKATGEFSAAVAEKLLEVRSALGIG